MSDTDRLHRAGEYLRKQEQHQHADAVDQACHDLDNLRTRIQEVADARTAGAGMSPACPHCHTTHQTGARP